MKPHGNTGKRNAAKKETLDTYVFFRCTSAEKTAILNKAASQGKKLRDYVLSI